MQTWRLDPKGLAKPGETSGLMGMGPGLDHQEAAGHIFGGFWNQTELSFRSKHRLLAGYLDPLLTLVGTDAHRLWSIFAHTTAHIENAEGEDLSQTANMTPDHCVEYHLGVSEGETTTHTSSSADMD